MKNIKLPALGVLAVWAVLTLGLWFGPRQQLSQAERRPLAQAPELTMSGVLSGKFMKDFESFTLDQFPLRDQVRQIKSLFQQYALGRKDNNGIYLSGGYAAQQEYPLSEASLDYAAQRFRYVYDRYLQGSRVVFALVPDKGQYLAPQSGNLSLDYAEMEALLREKLPWAEFVSLDGCLSLDSYYRTDTHWRQEALIPAAQALCEALGTAGPEEGDFTQTRLELPFYGVYYGQAALPMEPETLVLLENDLLRQCRVYDYESGSFGAVYDLEKLTTARDPYDLFLSGSRSLLTIENPAGTPGRELIVFRDSFGSSLVPLLVQEYSRVTLVDIRYIQPGLLDQYLEFNGQDVLFLYSTLVLNNSETIK